VRESAGKTFSLLDRDRERHIAGDPRDLRPADVDRLEGDATKAREAVGREPAVGFDELVTMMIEADLEPAEQERTPVNAGLAALEWNGGRP